MHRQIYWKHKHFPTFIWKYFSSHWMQCIGILLWNPVPEKFKTNNAISYSAYCFVHLNISQYFGFIWCSINILKCTFKNHHPLNIMYLNKLVCLYIRINSPIYAIFSAKHCRVKLINVYQFQDLRRIFTKIRAYTDWQTECIKLFNFIWMRLIVS